MKVIYDYQTNTLSVVFSRGSIAESDEGKPGGILDYATDGRCSPWKSSMVRIAWQSRTTSISR